MKKQQPAAIITISAYPMGTVSFTVPPSPATKRLMKAYRRGDIAKPTVTIRKKERPT